MDEIAKNDDDGGDDNVWAREKRCFVAQMLTTWLKTQTHTELCEGFGEDLGWRLAGFFFVAQNMGETKRLRK